MQSLKNCAPTEHVCNSFSNMETAEQGLGKRCFFLTPARKRTGFPPSEKLCFFLLFFLSPCDVSGWKSQIERSKSFLKLACSVQRGRGQPAHCGIATRLTSHPRSCTEQLSASLEQLTRSIACPGSCKTRRNMQQCASFIS